MSRGHGTRQRAVVDLLVGTEEAQREGLPLAALRPVLGPDRSDARRVIRSLVERGDAEWVEGEGGIRRLRLNWLLCVSVLLKREDLGDD